MSCTPGIPDDNYQSLMFWAERHKNANKSGLLSRVRKIYSKNPELIRNKVIGDAIKFHKMGKEVALELHRLKSFIRFEFYPEMFLFSKLNAEHDIVDLLLNFFTNRFPEFFIGLRKNNIIYLGTNRKDVKITIPKYKNRHYKLISSKLPVFLDYLREVSDKKLDFGDFTVKIYHMYYDSQYISTRKNIKAAKKFLPDKLRSLIDQEYEFQMINKKNQGNKKITDYF